MQTVTQDEFKRRCQKITEGMTKDENGFVGKNAAEKFDNMIVYGLMAISGKTEKEVRLQRKALLQEVKEKQFQESLAEVCP